MPELGGHGKASPFCKTSTHRNTVIGASSLHVTHLPSSSDLHSERSHEMKGEDRTKEMHGRLEAGRRGLGEQSSICCPLGCLSVWPSEAHSTLG